MQVYRSYKEDNWIHSCVDFVANVHEMLVLPHYIFYCLLFNIPLILPMFHFQFFIIESGQYNQRDTFYTFLYKL